VLTDAVALAPALAIHAGCRGRSPGLVERPPARGCRPLDDIPASLPVDASAIVPVLVPGNPPRIEPLRRRTPR
jgi:hypothetical protein